MGNFLSRRCPPGFCVCLGPFAGLGLCAAKLTSLCYGVLYTGCNGQAASTIPDNGCRSVSRKVTERRRNNVFYSVWCVCVRACVRARARACARVSMSVRAFCVHACNNITIIYVLSLEKILLLKLRLLLYRLFRMCILLK